MALTLSLRMTSRPVPPVFHARRSERDGVRIVEVEGEIDSLTALTRADMPASWDFRRGPAAARILVELGADHGLSPEQCLGGTADASDARGPRDAGRGRRGARDRSTPHPSSA